MKLQPQQQLILVTIASITGFTDYNEIAERAGIKKHASVRTQLGRLVDWDLAIKESATSSKFQITDKGKEEASKSDVEPPPQVKVEESTTEVEEQKEPTAEEEAERIANEAVEKAVETARLAKEKRITSEKSTEQKDQPEVVEPKDRETAGKSREALKLTPYQIFIQMGHDMGGINVEKLRGIADVVFGDNPDDLDRVWFNLSAMNIAIDLKKQWFMLWQNYLRQSGKPSTLSATLESQLTPPDKRSEEQKKTSAKEGRNWTIDEDENGFLEPVQAGEGMGEFTFNEAMTSIRQKNKQRRIEQQGQAGHYPEEPASQLLTALAPYLKSDSKQDSIADVLTALAPYIKDNAMETKMEEMKVAITNAGGNKGGMSDQVVNMVKMLSALKEFGPVIRDVLGVQVAAPAQGQAQQTPIQLQNPDGSPMVMNLADFFSIQRFNAEQKREDDSAKGKQEFIKEVQGFIGKIGNAAQKAAG